MSTPNLRHLVGIVCPRFVAAEAQLTTVLSRAPASLSCRVRLRDGRSVIAKVYAGTATWKAEKEAHIIKELATSGVVRTAEVLGCGQLEEADVSVLFTSDLGDQTLWRTIEAGGCSRGGALRMVGQIVADFHDADIAIADGERGYRCGALIDGLVQGQLSHLRRIPSDTLAACVEPALRTLVNLCEQQEAEVGCHGDLHPANVVMCRSKHGALAPHLVDFESAVRGPPEYDLAKSMVTSSALGDSERSAILLGYGDRHAVSDELLSAFVVFHAVDGWVHAAMLEGRDQWLWHSRILEVVARDAPQF